jgi:hypothetical protein
MKKCGYCGRENGDEDMQCRECGTAFVAEPAADASKFPPSLNPAQAQMVYGALWCVGGTLVTLFTYMAAASDPYGGHYIIAWGAIVFGAVRFFQGLCRKNAIPSAHDLLIRRNPKLRADDSGYEALSYATRLEVEGRVQEAMALYRRIGTEFPDSDAGHDAIKSLESLQAKLQ